jgi:hypothetical protein
MFTIPTSRGRKTLRARSRIFHRNKARPRVELLEDRTAPATLTVNTTADNTTDTSVLTLRDAITLVNNGGNPTSLGQSTMPAGWASQINTANPFGGNDTIQFNISTSDPGYTAPISVGITIVSLSANVATLTTSAQVPVAVGQTIIVAGLSNSFFNGNYQVSAVTPTSVSYTLVHADMASTPDSGTAANPSRFTIRPQSALPQTLVPVTINGFSQPGSSANTMPNQGVEAGDNAVLTIILDGSNISAQVDGMAIAVGGSTVEGLVIQNFYSDIHLTSSGKDLITGNYLTDALQDLFVDNVSNNTIGGTTPEARNVIGGSIGVLIQGVGATGNQLLGDYIGNDGSQLLTGNFDPSYAAVRIIDASNNIVGGTAPGAGNVIANFHRAILIAGSTAVVSGNVVQGNYMGPNAAGTGVFSGLGPVGIGLANSTNNTIGGTTASARNVISGWQGWDIGMDFSTPLSSGDVVEGNYVGTNAAGTASLGPVALSPNGPIGIDAAVNSVILDNLISGGLSAGVRIPGNSGCKVQGNLIGTDATGTQPIPNLDGVDVDPGANNNLIGGTSPGTGNTIAFNVGPGVWVRSDPFGSADPNGAFSEGTATGIRIQGNSLYANGGLGITLGSVAVDVNGNPLTLQQVQANPSLWNHDEPSNTVILNDSLDHVGANNFRNYPVLTSASSSSAGTSISGTFTEAAEPNTTITLDFYANAVRDSSGHGQGQTYLGSITVMTDGNGKVPFAVDLPTGNFANQWLSATATGPDQSTSEFSADVPILAPIYSFGGFLPPLSNNLLFNQNRTIPIKWQLKDTAGNLITSLSAVSSLQVAPVLSGGALGTPFNPTPTGGTSLRNDGSQYVFNWQTKGLSVGSYEIILTLADGTVRTKTLQIVTNGGSNGLLVDGTSSATSGPGGLLGGDIDLYVDNTNGDLTADELARIQDAVTAANAVIAPYGVAVTEVTDPTLADVTLNMDTTSAVGGYADGVLGCTTDAGQITIINGWNFYAGSDATQIGSAQYDFETVVEHELGHALGLGHSTESTSVMYATLDTGAVNRTLTTADLNVPDTGTTGACGLHAAVIPMPVASNVPLPNAPSREAFFAMLENATPAPAVATNTLAPSAYDAVFANPIGDIGTAKFAALSATPIFGSPTTLETVDDSFSLSPEDGARTPLSPSAAPTDRPDLQFDFIPADGTLVVEC